MFFTILWGFLALILGSILYFCYTLVRDAKYFRDRGVLYLGNSFVRLAYMFFKGISMSDNSIIAYGKVKAKKQRFSGGMQFGNPCYFIVDLDLAKQILVKDFDHFVDRSTFNMGQAQTRSNEIMQRMLVFQEGEKWKALRSKMSPTFTTGKIRRMFGILNQSGNRLVKYLEGELSKSDGILDLQKGFSKYTMDVIASVAFGIDSKAFEQTDPSLFEQMGDKLKLKLDPLSIVKYSLIRLSPKLADFLGVTVMESEAMDFFSDVIKSGIKYRRETKEKRDDFLQLILEARAGQLKPDDRGELNEFENEAEIVNKGQGKSKMTLNLEDDDIVAQCVLFILGGFDNTQAFLLFAAYSLAVYPEIQERLFQEVKKSIEDNQGELTYDSVSQMEYMEMYMCETLRYYTPGVISGRLCTKSFRIPDSNVTIEKGMSVILPVHAFHRDVDNYPEPDKFNPERFSPENRPKIHPCAFMPFGVGPRSCIAMRLALAEAKMAVAHLVLNFIFEPSERTPIPMKFTKSVNLYPEGGLWLKLKARK